MGKKKDTSIMFKREFKENLEEFMRKASALGKAVEELKATGINERVLFFAIQQSSNRHLTKYGIHSIISVSEIKAICAGLEGIREYLFPEDGE